MTQTAHPAFFSLQQTQVSSTGACYRTEAKLTDPWSLFVTEHRGEPARAVCRAVAKKLAPADMLKLLDKLNAAGRSTDSYNFVVVLGKDWINESCPILAAGKNPRYVAPETRLLAIAVGLTPGQSAHALKLAIQSSDRECPHLARVLHDFHGTSPYVEPAPVPPTEAEIEAQRRAKRDSARNTAIVELAMAIDAQGFAHASSMRRAEKILQSVSAFFGLPLT